MEMSLEFIKGLDLRGFNEISVTLRFVLAVLFGGIIGLEREHKHRPAGFRTHILVCMGAASVMMTSQYLINLVNSGVASFTCDPARLGAQVISGIGFVGAGTIMVTKRRQVKGLTTAAGLWDSAIIGLAIGVITGNWAYKRIPNKLFTYIVYAYIGISGTIIFFSA